MLPSAAAVERIVTRKLQKQLSAESCQLSRMIASTHRRLVNGPTYCQINRPQEGGANIIGELNLDGLTVRLCHI